jgi:hypothetical protein
MFASYWLQSWRNTVDAVCVMPLLIATIICEDTMDIVVLSV